MKLSDFRIGLEFRSNEKTYRCTDVGTRTLIAIRVDQVETMTLDAATGEVSRAIYNRKEAEDEGWFRGPPYPVAEVVFDEDDIEELESDDKLLTVSLPTD